MSGWLNFDEAVSYLNCERDYLKVKVEQKEVPHSILPGTDIIRFNTKRLDEWLLEYEVTSKTKKFYSRINEERSNEMTFIDEIIKRFKLSIKRTIKYTDIYRNATERKVCAQLHPSNTGVDLAIKEAEKDDSLPVCSYLQRVNNIEDISGCWRANKSWLLGDGTRFTTKRAAAFHIPVEIFKDPDHAGWNEIKALLDYAYRVH
jgi:hypothetical protein